MLTPFSADVKDPPFREIIRNLSSSLRESFWNWFEQRIMDWSSAYWLERHCWKLAELSHIAYHLLPSFSKIWNYLCSTRLHLQNVTHWLFLEIHWR
jgi:hypothetical protein